MTTYNYYSETEFYPDKYIKSLFDKRGNWNRISKEELKLTDKKIHFMYINGKYFLEKYHYGIKAELKNTIDKSRHLVGKKHNLMEFLSSHKEGKKYILESNTIDMFDVMKNSEILNKYKELFNNKVYILKPVSGFAGADIEIVNSFNMLVGYTLNIINKWKKVWNRNSNYYRKWVLQEYLTDPLLLNEHKFHVRHFYIFRPHNEKSFYLKTGLIALALQPYKQSNWMNKDIHDTHFHGRDGLRFIDTLKLNQSEINYIYSQIDELYRIIDTYLKSNAKCYEEIKNCFETFGADLMFTKDYKLKILELNDSPGLGYEDREEVQDEKKSVIENIMSIIVDQYFPPKNKVENKFIDDVVFI
jgi:hypothetical protein